MFRLAVANLTQNKARFTLSIAGLGLALTLVLFFAAVFAGATDRLTVYIDRSGADIWVAQAGVRTMHMSTSVLPATVVDVINAVPGVERTAPVLYAPGVIQVGEKEYIAYVFGLAPDAPIGGP